MEEKLHQHYSSLIKHHGFSVLISMIAGRALYFLCTGQAASKHCKPFPVWDNHYFCRVPQPQSEKNDCTVQEGEPHEEQKGEEKAT